MELITAVKHKLSLDTPLDAAVFACLTTCFYAATRLGKFTVRHLDTFDPALHITPSNLSTSIDRHGNTITVLHLPKTKVSAQGKDIYWARQVDETNPISALKHHRLVNTPPQDSHLFAYRHKNGHRPLTKSKFIKRMAVAAKAAGLEPLQGHGIRIGATLEYLLRGVPFDVMKAKG
ncbi:hypothetical protein BYT27DRAFT_7206315 [Phlegmacium glaucopus]|nr:hypothetical protein BYT27DRAFT_7206315 [Phlegmacium glaucopus]